MGKRSSGRTVMAIVRFPDNKILLVKRGTAVFKGVLGVAYLNDETFDLPRPTKLEGPSSKNARPKAKY